MPDDFRADKWLWAVRLFKTRAAAAEACAAGKIRRAGHGVKAATKLHPGDILEVPYPEGPGIRTIHVVSVIQTRVSAAEAHPCYEESTPASVVEARALWLAARREQPRGRPTKKDRRKLNHIRGFFE